MFDRFMVVDWSANSTPKLGRDSVWMAVLEGAGAVSVTNLATRAAAESFLVDLIESDPACSTLIGVDFSLGYPEGTAEALGLAGTPWSAMWCLLADQIDDDHRNANNRFAVAAALNCRLTGAAAPFWGCPPSQVTATLASTKPRSAGAIGEWRAVEVALRALGHRPFSSWQLLGAGAVGGQSLLGIPMIERLRTRFGERLQIWPFTTGFACPPLDDGVVVVAEVWPSMLEIEANDTIRDAAQVRSTACWLAGAARSGELADMLSPTLSPSVMNAATNEEGWVLGVAG